MEVELIAMDLDGTALQPDHVTISPRLRDALETAHSRGIQIVPVTGRPYKLLPPVLEANPAWKQYGILCNGGQIRNLCTGEILYSLMISQQDLQSLVKLAQAYEIPMEFSADSRQYLTQRDWQVQQGQPGMAFHCGTILPKSGVVVDSLLPLCTDSHYPVEKVNLNCIPDGLRGKVEKALALMAVSGVWSSPNCMEITHKNATKGVALKRLCQMLGIPMEQVLALGDSGNDLSMLQMAGVGVAMGNAPEALQQAADAVTKSNEEDGAAIAIERFAL